MSGIELQNVHKTFGKKSVVDDISFWAKEGEILGFLGPNGAGKTTTIRMIMGIIAADKGNIHFLTEKGERTTIPPSSVGYLPEERGLYKEARVLNVLIFLAGLKNVKRSVAKERAMEWLKKFDLQNNAHSKIEELSKGMSQKVQFIASVIHKPKLIILDEPFSGLDPVSQDLFKTELRRLAEEGAVILLSSHQMNIMEELCSRIFLIHQGKEVFYGSLPEIKDRYGNYKIRISTTKDYDFQQLTSLSIISSSQKVDDKQYLLALAEKIMPGEFLKAVGEDCPIRELNITRSSLHDIFVKIALGGVENE